MIIPEPVLAALTKATAEGIVITLPQISDDTTYKQACQVLVKAGGHRIIGARYQFPSAPGGAAVILNDLLATGEIWTPRDTGFFPTPLPVVRQLLTAAGPLNGRRVLEPSAGQGAIAIPAAQAGGLVDCIEIHGPFSIQLDALGLFNSVLRDDFLALTPVPVYDAIIMNPPFRRGEETRHVLHAWDFLAPGGVLASVLTSGTLWRTDRNTKQLRTLVSVFGGTLTELPAGSFAGSGVQVSTVTLVIRKPAGERPVPSTAPAPPPDAYATEGLF